MCFEDYNARISNTYIQLGQLMHDVIFLRPMSICQSESGSQLIMPVNTLHIIGVLWNGEGEWYLKFGDAALVDNMCPWH
jgi:hypothetical protein